MQLKFQEVSKANLQSSKPPSNDLPERCYNDDMPHITFTPTLEGYDVALARLDLAQAYGFDSGVLNKEWRSF
jgi:hypothetical protein